MLKSFEHMVERACRARGAAVCIAGAEDMETLESARRVRESGVADVLLVGDERAVREMAARAGLEDVPIIHEPNPERVSITAAAAVRRGDADVLMKGLVNSRDFLKAVIDPDGGLRTGTLLSHLAILEVPGEGRMSFLTDGGINVSPDYEAKEVILESALVSMHAMGYKCPRVAIVAANEQVTPTMPATVDAERLMHAWEAGRFSGNCIVEGPVAMDVVFSAEAARHKGITSHVSGKTDLVMVPNIEAGNILGKAMMHYGGARMCGFVLGASAPVVLTSRNATAEEKFYSVVLSCLSLPGQSGNCTV